jgi:hypothetical protein
MAMAHDDDLEFTRSPRENLQTYDRVKRLIIFGIVAVTVVLLAMAAFLV